MLAQPDTDTCTPHCIQFSAEQATDVVDLERHVVMWSNFRLHSMIPAASVEAGY